MLKYATIVIFILLAVVFYYFSFAETDSSQIFLTVSTFLFAIFAGFFIARQGSRYSQIRDQITTFDGEMSSTYRCFGHLSQSSQEQVKKIITTHYQTIVEKKAWDYHFTHKSNTLTAINQLLHQETDKKNLKSLQHLAVQRILVSLEKCQIARKSMIALHQERIPKFQWIVIYILAIILLTTLSLIPSQHLLIASILKAAFATLIFSVLILLNNFDRLQFFEKTIGEKSAQDILNIFSGKR